MKKVLIFLMMVFANNLIKADTIPIESKVSNATIFLKGAQLLRKANVYVKKGKNTLSKSSPFEL